MTQDPLSPAGTTQSVESIPVRMEGTTSAVAITYDGMRMLVGAITGDQWRRALRVPDDRDLWAKQEPNDVLVVGEHTYDVESGISFYSAPRRISDS